MSSLKDWYKQASHLPPISVTSIGSISMISKSGSALPTEPMSLMRNRSKHLPVSLDDVKNRMGPAQPTGYYYT
jgi:hypothetical protein